MSNLNCGDIYQTLEADATLLDVRSTHEFSSGCLSDAKNIPLTIRPVLAHERLETDEPALICCRLGERAIMAEKILATPGFTDAVNIGGTSHYRHYH